MKTPTSFFAAFVALGLFSMAVRAQDAPAPERPADPPVAVEAPDAPRAPEAAETPRVERDSDASNDATGSEATDDSTLIWTTDRARGRGFRRFDGGDGLVTVFGSSILPPDGRTEAVVSVFGSSTSSGEVRDAVVSVFGNTRVEGGSVGDTAAAVFGNNFVNASVGDVVAVLGDVELGPQANVRGDVIVVGGSLKRDPAAHVSGAIQHVMSVPAGTLSGLRAWLDSSLRFARPLAFGPGIGWAWTIALGFLALYAVIAVMLREPVDRCVETLQKFPGQTALASLLAMLLTPLALIVLVFTFVGAPLVPFAVFGIFVATLFGKAVVLAWMGRGLLKFLDEGDRLHSAVAVLVGGGVVLLLYTVPVLGFLVFNVLGILAFGVVIYTLLLAFRARRQAAAAAAPLPSFAAPSPAAANTSTVPPTGAPTGYYSAAADMTGGDAVGDTSADEAPKSPPGGEGYVPPSSAQPVMGDAATLPRAGFWIRMLALLIDAILVGVVIAVLSDENRLQLIALATYGAIMWKMKGTTVGGIVCNLKVIRVDGRPLDWSTSIVRALSCFLSLVVVGLGFIWIAFDEGKQSWHDKIAGTAVVRVPQGVSLL